MTSLVGFIIVNSRSIATLFRSGLGVSMVIVLMLCSAHWIFPPGPVIYKGQMGNAKHVRSFSWHHNKKQSTITKAYSASSRRSPGLASDRYSLQRKERGECVWYHTCWSNLEGHLSIHQACLMTRGLAATLEQGTGCSKYQSRPDWLRKAAAQHQQAIPCSYISNGLTLWIDQWVVRDLVPVPMSAFLKSGLLSARMLRWILKFRTSFHR